MTNSKKVLFIDDEAALTSMIKTIFELQGLPCDAFEDAVVALETFKNSPDAYKAVITDMTMPKISGEEVAMAIHQISPQIPIILTSGYSPSFDRQSVNTGGEIHYFPKPFEVAKLIELIKKF